MSVLSHLVRPWPAGGGRARLPVPIARVMMVLAGWLLVALAWTPPTYWVERAQPSPGVAGPTMAQVFLEMLCFYVPWAALTPLAWRLGRAHPFVRGRLVGATGAHLLLGSVAVPLMVGTGRALGQALVWPGGPISPRAALHGTLITSFYSLPTFVALVAIGQIRRSPPRGQLPPAPGPGVGAAIGAAIGAGVGAGAPLSRIAVPERGRTDLVDLANVDYIDVDGHYLCIHVGTKVHLLRGALGELEQRLDPARFLRVHRSAIVQLDRVTALSERRNGDCVLLLRGGAEVPASRSYRAQLASRLHLDA